MTLRIGSLCSGYEGLGIAVQSVLGGELAFVADNDPGASKILAHRFPGVPNFGDITVTDWARVEPVDVLTAGFPCTDISCAGKRAGLRKGNRSGVWYFVAAAIAALRPPLVVIENVKELLSERADSDVEQCPWCLGDTNAESAVRALGAVLADLAEIGFDAEWVSVPAAAAGACHLRWRVFIAAWPAADAEGYGTAGHVAVAVHDSGQARQGPGAGDWLTSANPAGIGAGEPADEAHAVSGGRNTRALPGGRGMVELLPTPRAADGNGNGRAAMGREGSPALMDCLLPTPRATDGTKGGPNQRGSSGGPDAAECRDDHAAHAERGRRDRRAPQQEREPLGGTASPWDRTGAFGRYEAAVRHHERAFGRAAPPPVEPGRNGDPRLSPRFVEWMQGLPAGWVTDVPGLSRNAQLKALGNGVVPAQAAMALRLLLGADLAQAAA